MTALPLRAIVTIHAQLTWNHKVPHKGDEELLFDLDNTEVTCQTCHSGLIQKEESRGCHRQRHQWPSGRSEPSLEQDILVRTYFVRVAADKQVVGLFVAPSLVMLAALVDECCDPNTCEYASAGMGGIIVEQPTTATWPLLDHVDQLAGKYELATGLEHGALTQQWENDLRLAPNRLEWKQLTSTVPSIARAVARNNANQSEDRSEPDEKM